MGTRIQDKSRPTKRPMVRGTLDLNGNVYTADAVPARVPAPDKRGYPAEPKGVPAPTLSIITVTDSTPVAVFSIQSTASGSEPDIMIYFGHADPGDYTVFQVKGYADAVIADTVNGLTDQQKTDEIQRMLDLERAGSDRNSLTNYLDGFPGVI